MKLLHRTRGGASRGTFGRDLRPLEINQVFVPDVRIAIVNAVRVWSDARGKAHFEYLAAQPTRDPKTCSHTGGMWTRRPHGRPTAVRYTWARSSAFRLRCGDCGAELDG